MHKHVLLGGVIALLIVIGAFFLLKNPAIAPQISPSASATPSGSAIPAASSPTVSASQNIIVTSPTANAVVGNPITVIGRVRVFEGSFQYALRDASGKVWYQSTGQVGAPGENASHQPFTVKIPVPVGTPRNLIIEVFAYSAKDGAITDLTRVPVRLATQETSTVKIYLNDRRLNNNDSCDVVFPIDRTIIKTNEPAYISMVELLKGPIGTDEAQRYYTSIPDNVKVNSIRIASGTAYVDFNSQLEYQVGGSCRVLNIRAQIISTLKQFSNVRNVVISINGRTEDILQP